MKAGTKMQIVDNLSGHPFEHHSWILVINDNENGIIEVVKEKSDYSISGKSYKVFEKELCTELDADKRERPEHYLKIAKQEFKSNLINAVLCIVLLILIFVNL